MVIGYRASRRHRFVARPPAARSSTMYQITQLMGKNSPLSHAKRWPRRRAPQAASEPTASQTAARPSVQMPAALTPQHYRARARTVPLVPDLLLIVDRWSAGKTSDAWLFSAPEGGPLRESNWKRSVGWSAATSAVGAPGFRVHDLRHTAASVWLAAGADPKVVQRVLGHATAAMTMDFYGHMIDANLRQAAQLIGDISGTSEQSERGIRTDSGPGTGTKSH
jgi:hypothetical protein